MFSDLASFVQVDEVAVNVIYDKKLTGMDDMTLRMEIV